MLRALLLGRGVSHAALCSEGTCLAPSCFSAVSTISSFDPTCSSSSSALRGVQSSASSSSAASPGTLKSSSPRSPSAYNLFLKDFAAQYKSSMQQGAKMASGQLFKLGAAKYKALGEREKQHYEDQAWQLKQVKKATDKPRLPARKGVPSAYTQFVKDAFPKIKASNPGLKGSDVFTMIGQQWSALSAEQKAQYKAA